MKKKSGKNLFCNHGWNGLSNVDKKNLFQKPAGYSPLVYCWRGGQRWVFKDYSNQLSDLRWCENRFSCRCQP